MGPIAISFYLYYVQYITITRRIIQYTDRHTTIDNRFRTMIEDAAVTYNTILDIGTGRFKKKKKKNGSSADDESRYGPPAHCPRRPIEPSGGEGGFFFFFYF